MVVDEADTEELREEAAQLRPLGIEVELGVSATAGPAVQSGRGQSRQFQAARRWCRK